MRCPKCHTKFYGAVNCLNQCPECKSHMAQCFRCDKLTIDPVVDEGDLYYCMDCVKAWEKENNARWEDGKPMSQTGEHSGASPCSEYYVTVTLRIPHRLLGRITKKSIQSKDVEIVAADWDRVREIYFRSI